MPTLTQAISAGFCEKSPSPPPAPAPGGEKRKKNVDGDLTSLMVASSDATLVQGRSFDAKACCKCASDGRPSTPSKVLQIQCLVLKTDLACSPAAGWTPFDAPIDTAGEDMRQYDIRIRAQNAAYEAPSRGTFRFFVSTSQPYPPIPISSPQPPDTFL